MKQKKLYPILASRDEYEKVIELVERLNLEYQETGWYSIENISTHSNTEVKIVGVVADEREIFTVMNEMNYNFV